ncbi:MAG: hypothetical protein GC162_09600 [Planctomycetes bacterium]|nr:hypothetical protein [Planctomycetota bacterium]
MNHQRLAAASLALALLAATAHADLVGRWSFDTNGNAAVGPNTTLGANATIDTTNKKLGAGSLKLTGAGDDASAAKTSANYADVVGSASRTVALWIKAGTQTDTNPTLVSWGTNTNGQRFDVRLAGSNLRSEVQGGFIVGSSNIADGNWHHVVVALNDDGSLNINEAKLYVDGVAETISSSGAQAINTVAGNPLRIGNGLSDTTRNFVGNIDDVRIYNNTLSASEVFALARASLNFDAKYDTSGDNEWTDQADVDNAFDIRFRDAANAAVTKNAITYGGITCYDFNGSEKAGFFNGSNGTTLQTDFVGDPTDAPASFEMLFSADTLTGNQLLMDLGGNGIGTSLSLSGSVLELTTRNGGSYASATVDLASLGLGVNAWVHTTMVLDTANDVIKLYVDGTLRASAAFTPNDWSGDDGGAGLPGEGLANLMGLNASYAVNGVYGGFDGKIALFRMYEFALTNAQISTLAAIPAPTPAALPAGLALMGLLTIRRRK